MTASAMLRAAIPRSSAGSMSQAGYSTARAMRSSACSVRSVMWCLTMTENTDSSPASLKSQATSTFVLLLSPLRVTSLVPVIGPSVIFVSIDVGGLSVTFCIVFESLNAITTSRFMTLPSLLMFLTAFVPCQDWASLSTSDTIAHTLSSGAAISRLAFTVVMPIVHASHYMSLERLYLGSFVRLCPVPQHAKYRSKQDPEHRHGRACCYPKAVDKVHRCGYPVWICGQRGRGHYHNCRVCRRSNEFA